MAEATNLPRFDPPPVEEEKALSPNFKRWLTDTVDNLNTAMQDIEDAL